MFNPSQPVFTNLRSQFHQPTDPNNPYVPVSQPLIPSAMESEPSLQPPGSLPYASFGFQAQSSIAQNPYAGSQNWGFSESAPISYDSVTQPGNEAAFLPTSSNLLWAHQFPTVDATTNVLHHLQGLEHNKNWQMRSDQTSLMLTNPGMMNAVSFPNQMGIVNGLEVFGSSTMNSSPELEMKKLKALSTGNTADAVRVCAICNVVCNSKDVFNKHMAGKKHAVQANLASFGEVGSYFAAVRAQFEGKFKKAAKKMKAVPSAWCEVCQIMCNSNDVYIAHLSGKKHQKNAEQLRNGAAPTNALIGPKENGATEVPVKASVEEMQAKRQKVVAAGAASAAIRTCTICNVVCNSVTVFNFHLGGQKHKDMVKRLQES